MDRRAFALMISASGLGWLAAKKKGPKTGSKPPVRPTKKRAWPKARRWW